MTANIYTLFSRLSPKLRGIFYKRWYQILSRFYQRKDWIFMNYGYAPLTEQRYNQEIGHKTDQKKDQTRNIDLDKGDEENRYFIQLYHHVAGAVDIQGLEVLEVGSGRGGGAEYIKRYLKPERMVGVDLSERAVTFCNNNYVNDGLSFKTGSAESLPFPDESFDIVLNVESSHCYGSMSAFLGQVKRVLREGGYFLFADFRRTETLDGLREKLKDSGLTLIKETNITANIIEALDLDNQRRTALIKEKVPKPLVAFFLQFAGAEGSKIHERFCCGETLYLNFVMQK